MRVPLILPALALLTTGVATPALAQATQPTGAEKLHSNLSRIFASGAAEAPESAGACCEEEASGACCEGQESQAAAPVASRPQQAERGFMGVQMNVNDGAMVIIGVIDGSPAAKAGLEAGDRIVRIGEHQIGDQGALTEYLAGIGPGQTQRIAVERNGWTKELDLTFASRPGVEQSESADHGSQLHEEHGQGNESLLGEGRGNLRERIRDKLNEARGGDEPNRNKRNRSFFSDDSGGKEDMEIRVDVRQEDSHEPEVRIRINGEEMDLAELAEKGLSGLHFLENLDGLEGLVELKNLKGLSGLVELEGLDGLKGLAKLKGLKGLSGLAELKHLGARPHDGHGGHDARHEDGPHDEAGSDEHSFRWSTDDGHGEVSELREELRELRQEMRELRRERLSEVERLRQEVQSLIRSLDK